MKDNVKVDTIISNCKDCGKQFEISPNEQKYYKFNNLELPKRCSECRKKRKKAKQAEEHKKAEEERIRKAEED